jgi:hypothetical protein
MFGFLPDWVGDTLTLIALVLGTPGIILYLLGRKDANRKLVVDEGGLTVDQFNAALPAYKDLLDRSNKDRDAAISKMGEYKVELDNIRDNQERLVKLFLSVVARSNITLTADERAELEATRPKSFRRIRPATSP